MKVTFFSDTHGLHRKVKIPESDLLIFGGDCMTCGYKEYELIDFLKWFEIQDAEHKIMIAGNHDRMIENFRGIFRELLLDFPSITYLENSGIRIRETEIWGTPDSKKFCNWAFNRSEEELEKSFSRIPDDVEILVSHAPQYGILDRLENGNHVGELTLTDRMDKLKDLRYHLSGHIHCSYGKHNNRNHISINGSIVNEQYELANKPISFKIYPHG